jgi:hypothetical protein
MARQSARMKALQDEGIDCPFHGADAIGSSLAFIDPDRGRHLEVDCARTNILANDASLCFSLGFDELKT